MQIEVPTYDPNTTDPNKEYDHSRPETLTLTEMGSSGLRIIMGDDAKKDAPDVMIEHADSDADEGPVKPLWRVFVHADGGDPEIIIEFTEDKMVVYDGNQVRHAGPLFTCDRVKG